VLDPDVVLRADRGAVPAAVASEVRGAAAVASQALTYSRHDLRYLPALINGAAGVVSIRDGQPFAIMGVIVRGGRIVAIDILADPARLHQLDLTVLDD